MNIYISQGKSTNLQQDQLIFKDKKVLCLDFFNCTPHIETSLECCLRLAHLDASVSYLFLGQYLPINEGYVPQTGKLLGIFPRSQYEQRLIKATARYARSNQLKFTALKPLKINWQSHANQYIDKLLAECQSVDEIKSISDGHKQIGLAIANTLIWLTKDSSLNPSDHTDLITNSHISYLTAYALADSAFSREHFDYVLIFNGRFCSSRACQDAASAHNVTPLFHERGATHDRFTLRTYMPHHQQYIQQEMLKLWQSSILAQGCASVSQTAESFFSKSRKGISVGWSSFTDHQQNGPSAVLVQSLRCDQESYRKPIVCYFSSSDDEFTAVGGNIFPEGVFGSQLKSLKLFYDLACKSKCNLIIRVHPHVAQKGPNDREKWALPLGESFSDVTVVPPDSGHSTYELIDLADVVVVYNSTVGIEAVASGKPVILLGNSFYDSIGATLIKPVDTISLTKSIEDSLMLTVNPLSAHPYGYWAMMNGNHFKYYQSTGLHTGSFLGINRNR